MSASAAKRSPLAVLLPCSSAPYQEATPTCSVGGASRRKSEQPERPRPTTARATSQQARRPGGDDVASRLPSSCVRRARHMVRVSAVALADLSARRRVSPSCRRQRGLQPGAAADAPGGGRMRRRGGPWPSPAERRRRGSGEHIRPGARSVQVVTRGDLRDHGPFFRSLLGLRFDSRRRRSNWSAVQPLLQRHSPPPFARRSASPLVPPEPIRCVSAPLRGSWAPTCSPHARLLPSR